VVHNGPPVRLRLAAEMLAGRTIADVESALDGDQLGDAPAAVRPAAAVAFQVAGRPGAMDDLVRLSFGDVPGSEYAVQLFADHLVHGWDLAIAIGRPTDLDPDASTPAWAGSSTARTHSAPPA
jgi:hypothetical protein